jgi:hypothetical protein
MKYLYKTFFSLLLIVLLISCDVYSERDICLYKVSKDRSTKRIYTGEFTSISLSEKADVHYFPLTYTYSEPYVEIEGPTSVVKRIECYLQRDRELVIGRKCLLYNSAERVKIKIYGHALDYIHLGSQSNFLSEDTIRSISGFLYLNAKYTEAGGETCQLVCSVNSLIISGSHSHGTLKISGRSDTTSVDLYGNGATMSVDLRELNYSVLNFTTSNCNEENPVNYAISYAGSPERINFVMDHCRELRYRGTPVLNGASGSRVYSEF